MELHNLIACVAGHYGLSLEHLLSRDITRRVVRVRHLCMYLAREEWQEPLHSIAEMFDHDVRTVARSVEQVRFDLYVDPDLKRDIQAIKRRMSKLN